MKDTNLSPSRRVLNKLEVFKDLGYEPHAGQLKMHQSNAPRRVLACGVRWGKSKAAAMEAITSALAPTDDSVGWIVAPTYDLADRVFSMIQASLYRSLRQFVISQSESERWIKIRNLKGCVSTIRAKSADSPVSLLGEGLDWLIVDEAARIKESIWNSHLSQRLIDKKGWALLISTPRGKGWYYDAYRRGQGKDPDYESWNQPSWMNPRLSREQIDQERNRIPDLVFRQEYGAEFCEGSGAVFRHVLECATGELTPEDRSAWCYGGLDLARFEDYTVFVIGDHVPGETSNSTRARVRFFDRFRRQDWAIQSQRIRADVGLFGHVDILMDSTGMGEPIFESFWRNGCDVKPYQFTAHSKRALIDNLALLIENRKIILPRPELWPEAIDELQAFEYSLSEMGNYRMNAPSGMHDDCVIALALFAWQAKPDRPQPSITILEGRM